MLRRGRACELREKVEAPLREGDNWVGYKVFLAPAEHDAENSWPHTSSWNFHDHDPTSTSTLFLTTSDSFTINRRNGQVVGLEYTASHTSLTIGRRRSVPTHDDIAVPETLLKKQKQQAKVTETRAADLKKKREVRYRSP